MKISIITVAYNSGATIRDTIESVLAQDYSNLEHVIVDGASTDSTLDIINSYGSRIARVVSEPDKGIYDAMNKGIALATGGAVGFLNSDDILADPGAVAAIAKALSESDVDAVFGDLVLVDPVHLDRVRRYWRPGPYRSGGLLRGWMAPHPTLYVRRPLLLACGGFDLSYRLQADFDLELRLFELMRIRSHYLRQTLVRMRTGGATTGSWRNIMAGNLEAERAARSHGFRGGLPFIAIKMLSRVAQIFARPQRARLADRR